MPTDTLKRYWDREEALRLGGAERKKRLGELQGEIRAAAVAVIALASELPAVPEAKQLEELLESIRTAAEQMRAEMEALIATALQQADAAAGFWEAVWKAALSEPAKDRVQEADLLRWVLEGTGKTLQEALSWVQGHDRLLKRPLAQSNELEVRAAEFPLWARECLARWEMLDRPALPLDPERIARAHAAYARGEHEGVDDVLSRIKGGGPWVKE
jgi:hypothetical protein